MTTALRFALVAALVSVGSGAANAQVFKCVDAGGKTVYSQSPCPRDNKSTTLKTSPPPSAAAAKGDAKGSGPKTAAELDQEFRKRQKEQGESQKKQEEQLVATREKEENCKRARQHLQGLDTGRQSRIDDKGERVFLEEAEIEREKDRARKSVQSYCG
jgi:hypothetical protein